MTRRSPSPGSDGPLGPDDARLAARLGPAGTGSHERIGPDAAAAAPGPFRPGLRPVRGGSVRLGMVAAGVALCTVAGAVLSATVAQRTVVGQGAGRWEVVRLLALWLPVWVAGAVLIRRLPGRCCLLYTSPSPRDS